MKRKVRGKVSWFRALKSHQEKQEVPIDLHQQQEVQVVVLITPLEGKSYENE